MIPAYLVYGFAGLFILIGCTVTVLGVRICKNGRSSSKWPSAEGIVREAKVVETFAAGLNDRRAFQPAITYEYSVDGRAHVGKRIKFVDIAASSSYAHRIIAEYPVGKRVSVYYDPQSPRDAVLSRGNDGNSLGIPAVGIFFAVVGLAIALAYGLRLFPHAGN